MRIIQGMVVCVLLAALATLSPTPWAWSHAAMVKSSPVNGASLKQSPPVIRAWFSEELAKGSIMRLYDGHQKLLATGGFDVSVSNHEVLKIVPAHLVPGAYVIQWYAISADDGATEKGSFRFSVVMGAMAPSGSTASLPLLRVVAPANRAHVRNPVALEIETPGDISQLTMGSDMGGMPGMGPHVHLHVVVDGQAFMPTVGQLARMGSSRYQYRLPKLSAGAHTIKVYWADNNTHNPASGVQAVTCSVDR